MQKHLKEAYRLTGKHDKAAALPELHEMNVGQVMTTQVSWVGPDTTLPEIARRMRAEDIGSVPVAHNDRLIGMVTDRDIVVRAVADGGEIERVTARQVMSRHVLYCYEERQCGRRPEEHG